MHITIPKVAVIGVKPTMTGGSPTILIPAHWPIYSAPRPLYGHMWQVWNAPFRTFGCFLATVCPDCTEDEFDAKYNAEAIEQNRRLDARELIFVTEEEAFAKGVEVTREESARHKNSGKFLSIIDERANDPSMRLYFVHAGLDAMTDPHAFGS
jgi:hypothetical protein